MFIIEGPDNVGKTTAAEKVVKIAAEQGLTDVKYQHMSKPKANFDYCDDYIKMMGDRKVADRFHIGGIVWPYLGCHKSTLDIDKLRVVEANLMLEGSFTCIIAARDSWYEERQKTLKRDEMFDANIRMRANKVFTLLARRGLEMAIPMSTELRVDAFYCVHDDKKFLPDDILKKWVVEWVRRVKAVEALHK